MDKSLFRGLADKFNQLPEEKKKSVLEELNNIGSESGDVDELLAEIKTSQKFPNNQSQKILKKTACDFCREPWCWFEKKHVNKGFCDKFKLFDTGKRIANERALALYEQELRRFKKILNVVSKDGTGGELISVGGSLVDFKKALEDDK